MVLYSEYIKKIYYYPVHEHNHTRFLVPEVLCSLVGPETQNCSYPIRSHPIPVSETKFYPIIFVFKRL